MACGFVAAVAALTGSCPPRGLPPRVRPGQDACLPGPFPTASPGGLA